MKRLKRTISFLSVFAVIMGLFTNVPVVHAEPVTQDQETRTYVQATLGAEPVFDGLSMQLGNDWSLNETPVTGEKDGMSYWLMETSKVDGANNSFQMYGSVDDSFLFWTTEDRIAVDVTYFDSASGWMEVTFNSDRDWTDHSDAFYFTGTNTWKSHTFIMDRPHLDSAMMGGSDFKLNLYVDGPGFSGSDVLIHQVTVRKEGGAKPHEFVQATLGAASDFDGLSMQLGNEGALIDTPVTGEKDGLSYWLMETFKDGGANNSFQMYGLVDDSFLHWAVDYYIAVDVTYFDSADGHLTATFNSGKDWTDGSNVITFTGTNTWKTDTLYLDSPNMDNAMLGGSDFKLNLYAGDAGFSGSDVMIHQVTVRKAERPAAPREYVQATLGASPVYDGLVMKMGNDSALNDTPVTGEKDGVSYWLMETFKDGGVNNSYQMYGCVDDSFLHWAVDYYIAVDVTYFDSANGHLTATFNSGKDWTDGSNVITFTGTNTWKTETLYLDSPNMDNAMLGGSDFKLNLYVDGPGFSGSDVMIHQVTVRKTERPAAREYVQATLGAEPVFDGLTMKLGNDWKLNDAPVTGEKDGAGYWLMETARPGDNGNGFSMYGCVDDDFIYWAVNDYIAIDVTYFDVAADGHLVVGFNSDKAWDDWSDILYLTGTNTWKTHTFYVSGAHMDNSMFGSSDFKLNLYHEGPGFSKSDIMIHQITVRRAERPKVVEASLNTGKVGNIFHDKETMNGTLTLSSNFDGENDFTVNYWVKNAGGLVLQSGNFVQHFAGQGSTEVELDFLKNQTEYGTFTLETQILNAVGEECGRSSMKFSRIRTGVQQDQFGTCVVYHRDAPVRKKIYPMMEQSGLSLVRGDMHWTNIEREKGVYDFSLYDPIVDEMLANNLEPLVVLGFSNPLYVEEPVTSEEELNIFIEGFANYCTAVVEHYRGKIRYFEVLNEYGTLPGQATTYAKILVAAGNAVHAANPDATVLGFAQAHANANFIGEVLDYPGAYEVMDAAVIHPYTQPRKPEGGIEDEVDTMLKEFEKRDLEPLPIWFTEIGWTTTDTDDTATEMQAANYSVRAMLYTLANADKVKKVLFYDFQNDSEMHNFTESNFGLIDHWQDAVPYAAKADYASISAFTAVIDGYVFDREELLNGGIHVCRFKDKAGERDDLLAL